MGKNKLSFWAFEGNRQEYRQALIEQIVDRVEKYRSKGYIKSAISCCEGAMKRYWNAPEIQLLLGMLYEETGDKVRAGRYFYFKKDPTESESACIRLFEQHFGDDTVLILKRLLNKECQPVSELDLYTKQRLNELIRAVELKKGMIPVFLQGMKRHFEKIGLE